MAISLADVMLRRKNPYEEEPEIDPRSMEIFDKQYNEVVLPRLQAEAAYADSPEGRFRNSLSYKIAERAPMVGVAEGAINAATGLLGVGYAAARLPQRIAGELAGGFEGKKPGEPGWYADFSKRTKEEMGRFTYEPRTPAGKAVEMVSNAPAYAASAAGEFAKNRMLEAGYSEDQANMIGDGIMAAGIIATAYAGTKVPRAWKSAATRLNKALGDGNFTAASWHDAGILIDVANGDPILKSAMQSAKPVSPPVTAPAAPAAGNVSPPATAPGGSPVTAAPLTRGTQAAVTPPGGAPAIDLSGMGKGMAESFIDMLYGQYQKNSVKNVAGTNELSLMMADRLKNRGILLDRDRLKQIVYDVEAMKDAAKNPGATPLPEALNSYMKARRDEWQTSTPIQQQQAAAASVAPAATDTGGTVPTVAREVATTTTVPEAPVSVVPEAAAPVSAVDRLARLESELSSLPGNSVQYDLKAKEIAALRTEIRSTAEAQFKNATSALDRAIAKVKDPSVTGAERRAALAEVKAAARAGLRANEDTAVGLMRLGFTQDEANALRPILRNVRSAKAAPSDVPTQIVDTPQGPIEAPVVVDTTSAIKKTPRPARQATPVAEDAPLVSEPGASQVGYSTVSDVRELGNAIRREGIETSPLIEEGAPLQLRTENGRVTALLIDEREITSALSMADLQDELRAGRTSPEVVAFGMRKLNQQAIALGVPVEEAHLYGSGGLTERAMQLAKENNLAVYRAVREKGALHYEIIEQKVVDATGKLLNSADGRPSRITPEEAAAYVADKTRPIGTENIAKINEAVETGRIPDNLPAEAIPHAEDIVAQGRKGVDSSEPMSPAEVVNDVSTVLDTIMKSTRYLSNESGALNLQNFRMSPQFKAALVRLSNQAKKYGDDFVDMLTRSGQISGQLANNFNEYLALVGGANPPQAINPRNMVLDAQAVQSGYNIVKQRVLNRLQNRFAAPVHDVDANAMYNSRNIKRGLFPYLEMPSRLLEQANLGFLSHAYRGAQKAANTERAALIRDLRAMSKSLNAQSRERIGQYALAQDPTGVGMKILNRYGINQAPALNAIETQAYNGMRQVYENFFTRINEVRVAIGQEPLKYEPNYFTRMRTYSVMERLGVGPNLIRDSAKAVDARFAQYATTPFPYAKLRKGAAFSAEFDAFKVLNTYSNSAVRQIHIAPFVAKLHEMIDFPLPNPKTGAMDWYLQREKPTTHAFLREWNNYLATGRGKLLELPENMNAPVKMLQQNMAFALLSGNLRSAGIQITTIRNTYYAAGAEHTARGIGMAISDIWNQGKNRAFAFEHSNILDSRRMTQTFNDVTAAVISKNPGDFLRAARRGQFGEIQSLAGEAGLKFLEYIDQEAALYSWHAAYDFASKKRGMNVLDASRYADDLVVRTQGSAMPGDLAAIQHTVGGKALTQFQTFVISDWNFLTRDVFGIGNKAARAQKGPANVPFTNVEIPFSGDVNQVVKNALRLTAATTAVNLLLEDVMGIQSPFPTPIKDLKRGLNAGDNVLELAGKLVAGTLIEPMPIVGATRYGKGMFGPIGEITRDLGRAFRDDPLAPGIVEASAKVLGVPGTQQFYKTQRGLERGENVYNALTGWYSQDDESSGRRPTRRPKRPTQRPTQRPRLR